MHPSAVSVRGKVGGMNATYRFTPQNKGQTMSTPTPKPKSKGINLLTDRQVKTAPTGKHADGGGLYLIVDASGARRWCVIYTVRGKRREMGLGGVLGLSLATARIKRQEIKTALASGIDPLAAKQAQRVAASAAKIGGQSFGDFADHWFETYHAPSLTNAKSADQWRMTLKVYAATIRNKPVAEIDTTDVLSVLTPIWHARAETARRLRQRIEKVLDAATTAGARGDSANPARLKGHLDNILPKSKKLSRGHHAAMPWKDVPAFMIDLAKREAMTAKALAFIILTASRAGEALGARWGEIDMEAALWVVPANRMKAKKEHRVPLSSGAMAILQDLAPIAGGDQEALVFPGQTVRPMSLAGLEKVRERMGIATVTTHGFRSSFRDWAGEATNAPREIAEACLAHEIGNAVEQAYRRGDALDKRRDLLEQWSNFCSGLASAKVIPIGARSRA
jgi:integrase